MSPHGNERDFNKAQHVVLDAVTDALAPLTDRLRAHKLGVIVLTVETGNPCDPDGALAISGNFDLGNREHFLYVLDTLARATEQLIHGLRHAEARKHAELEQLATKLEASLEAVLVERATDGQKGN